MAEKKIAYDVEWTAPTKATIRNHSGLKERAARDRLTDLANALVDHAIEGGEASCTVTVKLAALDG